MLKRGEPGPHHIHRLPRLEVRASTLSAGAIEDPLVDVGNDEPGVAS